MFQIKVVGLFEGQDGFFNWKVIILIPEMERAENFTSKYNLDHDLHHEHQGHLKVKSIFLNGKP